MKDYFLKNIRLLTLGFLFFSNIFIWHALINEELRTKLTISFLNVGQGDAIFIEAPNGNQILIDGGSGKSVLRELGKILPYYDKSIDVVLATHPDQDHIGGLPDIFHRFKIKYFLDSGVFGTTATYKELEETVNDKKIEKIIARRGMKINLGGGVVLVVLFPNRDMSKVKNTNDGSIVAKLTYGKNSVVLTGDAPIKTESYLVSIYGKKLKSDILKLGHHGSRTSSSASFLGFVKPDYAIISSGLNNSYGHPHKEVTDLLEKFKIPYLKTYESGTIVFKSDGEVIEKISY